MAFWNILQTFGIFYDHLVHLCSFGTFCGIMHREKSGNPDRNVSDKTFLAKNIFPLLASTNFSACIEKLFCRCAEETTPEVLYILCLHCKPPLLSFPNKVERGWVARWYILKPKFPIWVNFQNKIPNLGKFMGACYGKG
jgi:hypothetical protein